ncbi:hypothetical protein ACH44C_33540 [Streptomyces purpureus]|uniref:hypothetical protein n=1 Tax=Streptomyces purpureus TaxID=1951 RepID=UPI003796A56B
MPLAVIVFPMLALLAAAGLIALAPSDERYAIVLPAVRTVAVITAATVYAAALFHGARP